MDSARSHFEGESKVDIKKLKQLIASLPDNAKVTCIVVGYGEIAIDGTAYSSALNQFVFYIEG